jgi:hypothetical protein
VLDDDDDDDDDIPRPLKLPTRIVALNIPYLVEEYL